MSVLNLDSRESRKIFTKRKTKKQNPFSLHPQAGLRANRVLTDFVTTNIFDFTLDLFTTETEPLVKTARPYPFCQSRFFQCAGRYILIPRDGILNRLFT